MTNAPVSPEARTHACFSNEHEKILSLAATLAADGMDRTKEIIVAIGNQDQVIDPAWFEFYGTKPSFEIAACIVLGVLELLWLCDDYAILLAGPNIAPRIVNEPRIFFDQFSNVAHLTHEAHPAIC